MVIRLYKCFLGFVGCKCLRYIFNAHISANGKSAEMSRNVSGSDLNNGS